MAASDGKQTISILMLSFLVVCLMLVLVPASPPPRSADSMPPAAPGPVAVLHVFLAVGQSNMSGRGLPIGGTEDEIDPRTFQYGAKVRTFRNATVPLDMHDSATGISPATTFAREYLKAQPANVGVLIIPAAHGGTAFTNAAATLTWSVGVASNPSSDLPAQAVAQTREGIAAATGVGYSAELKGVLWHQGEGNSAVSTGVYAARLDALIDYVRTRLASPKLPFVVGGLALEAIAATPSLANINKALYETPARVAYTGFAKSTIAGVNPGDKAHFSRLGVEYLGKSYLSGYWQATANDQDSPRGPAPSVLSVLERRTAPRQFQFEREASPLRSRKRKRTGQSLSRTRR